MLPISKTKANMKGAKPIALVLVLAIPLLAASLAWGQGGGPPASESSIEQLIKSLHEQGRQAALKGRNIVGVRE